MRPLALSLIVAVAACGGGDAAPDAAVEPDATAPDATTPDADLSADIVAGERVGPVVLGMTWAEVRAAVGAPPADPVVLTRLGHAAWPALGLEAVLTSSDDATLSDDALVIGVGATSAAGWTGAVRPGATRADVVAALGADAEAYGGRDHYPAGIVVTYSDADVATHVAVVAPYALAPTPPAMQPAATTPPASPPIGPAAPAGVVVDGRTIPVIDMHLHPGDYGAMAATGKAFITANLPPLFRPYAPELLDRLSDPYAPHVGIAAQTAMADVGHAVLFAVYTQGTTGYMTNEALEQLLVDPRNATADGTPWAWGMVSVDFTAWTGPVAAERLAAMRSFLAERPDLFIGIKLAHAHQGVRLDDADYHGLYAIAAELGVPVLLHTGFSPFPGTQDDPAYYDPVNLEALVTAYDGAHGAGRVDFVLSHVGQGDARAVAHALDLAEAHDNVWLELSALGRPASIDANGEPVSSTEPQLPGVLDQLRARDLIDRAMFASDGPQYSGAVRSYLGRSITAMQDAGFSLDEIEAVLSGNFRRLYLDE